MFTIKDEKFKKENYGEEEWMENWPIIYMLENDKKIYIGQTNSANRRMNQHKKSEEKKIFSKVHFIYSEEMNLSVTLEYESQLIQLIAADEKYSVTNRNAGSYGNDYFQRNQYEEKFSELWHQLKEKGIVEHEIVEIKNSDLFKYSPYKKLNESQHLSVSEIWNYLKLNEKQTIIVKGMPGSGKTIVAVFLMRMLKTNSLFGGKKIKLVIPQTSLRKTLKRVFRNIDGLRPGDIIGPTEVVKDEYDILLVDEAHRLHKKKNIVNNKSHNDVNKMLGLPKGADQLDWILKKSKSAVLFYDKKQVIGPSGIEEELLVLKNEVNAKFYNRLLRYYELSTQMRVLGGNGYIEYVDSLLNGKIQKKESFKDYDFKIVNTYKEFVSLYGEFSKKYELCRMVAGFAWPWKSKKDKSIKDIKIDGIARMWNNRTEDWIGSKTSIDEIGCIHSVQGYDLNYAFVIIGNDLRYDKVNHKIYCDRDSFYDVYGKKSTSNEEVLEYIKNAYYVLMTRGICGTYLYVCDKDLREYMQQYIDSI